MWPCNPTPGHISREKYGLKRFMYSSVHEALFTMAKTWKQPKRPSAEEWIKTMWCIYTMEYYSAITKKEIMPFAATLMGLEISILSEKSQIEKEKCREPAWGTPPMAKVMRKDASAYARVGSSLRKPPVPEHLPPKPESIYFTVSCAHLHLWLYGGAIPHQFSQRRS